MVPARKHLEADDLAGTKVDLRLEIGKELAVLEAEADALLDLAMGHERALHARVEPDGAGDAAVLRVIERNVGAPEEVRDACVGSFGHRNAGERTDLDQPLVDRIGPGDRPQRGFGERVGPNEVRAVQRHGRGELVAAQSRDDRIGPKLLGERGGKAFQEPVADIVAMLVADDLEAVDLQRIDDDMVAALARRRGQNLGPVGETRAVVQPRDRVGGRENRGPALPLRALLGLVDEVDIPPPAEQDQRHVERQRGARDPHIGTELLVPDPHMAEKGAAVPDEQKDGRDQDRKDDEIAARDEQPRVLFRRGIKLLDAVHAAGLTAKRLTNYPTIMDVSNWRASASSAGIPQRDRASAPCGARIIALCASIHGSPPEYLRAIGADGGIWTRTPWSGRGF